jgi:hypothetical protein
MNASEAFTLAGIIGFYYNRRSNHSIVINTEIAKALRPTLYKEFCKEAALLEKNSKCFSADFLKNPVDEKVCINDMEVYANYSFDSLLKILALIVS